MKFATLLWICTFAMVGFFEITGIYKKIKSGGVTGFLCVLGAYILALSYACWIGLSVNQ